MFGNQISISFLKMITFLFKLPAAEVPFYCITTTHTACSQITLCAVEYFLTQHFFQYPSGFDFSDPQYTDAMQLFRVLKAGQDSELKEYNNLKRCTKVALEEMKEEPSTVVKKAKHRSRSSVMSPNPSVDLPSEWYIECVDVLQEVMSERTSTHFISSGGEVSILCFTKYREVRLVSLDISRSLDVHYAFVCCYGQLYVMHSSRFVSFGLLTITSCCLCYGAHLT